MKKYFFFDIDGTLLPETGARVVSPTVRTAIKKLQADGHFCAIATGRAHCEAEKLRQSLGFSNMVSDGGNSIVLDGKLVALEPLPLDLCASLAAECDRQGIPWAFSPEDDCYFLTRFPNFPDCFYLEKRIKEDLRFADYPQIYKMYLICPPGQEQQLPSLSQLDWCHYGSWLYVEPANKAHGIRHIMDKLHAPYDNVVVFGDGKNDLSMFTRDWFCIAMGNAVPELKAQADYITLDCTNDGIVHALKYFHWL